MHVGTASLVRRRMQWVVKVHVAFVLLSEDKGVRQSDVFLRCLQCELVLMCILCILLLASSYQSSIRNSMNFSRDVCIGGTTYSSQYAYNSRESIMNTSYYYSTRVILLLRAQLVFYELIFLLCVSRNRVPLVRIQARLRRIIYYLKAGQYYA